MREVVFIICRLEHIITGTRPFKRFFSSAMGLSDNVILILLFIIISSLDGIDTLSFSPILIKFRCMYYLLYFVKPLFQHVLEIYVYQLFIIHLFIHLTNIYYVIRHSSMHLS